MAETPTKTAIPGQVPAQPVPQPAYRPFRENVNEERNVEAFVRGEVGAGTYPDEDDKFDTLARLTGMSSLFLTPWETGVHGRQASEYLLDLQTRWRGERLLTEEEANALAPDLDKPVKGEISAGALAYRMETVRSKRKYQQWLARAEAPTAWTQIKAGATGFLDPEIMATTLAMGGIGKIPQVVKAVGALQKVPVLGALTRGPIGVINMNAALMTAFEASTYPQRSKEAEVSLDELKSGVIHGTAFLTAQHYLLGAAGALLASFFNKAKLRWARTPVKVREEVLAQALADMEAGRKSTAGGILAKAQEAADGKMAAGIPGHTFKDIQHPSEVPFFQAFDRPQGGKSAELFDSPVRGQHATSDPGVPNNLAPYARRVSVPKDAKFLDLRTGMDTVEGKKLAETFGVPPMEGESLSQYLERVQAQSKTDISEGLTQAFRESGYAGALDTVQTSNGPKNQVVLFDEPAPGTTQWFEANQALRPEPWRMSLEQAKRISDDPAMSIDAGPELETALARAKAELQSPHAPKLDEIKALTENVDAQLKYMEDVAAEAAPAGAKRSRVLENPEYKAERQKLKQFDRESTLVEEGLRKFSNCISGRIY